MSGDLQLSDKEARFVARWSAIRAKGKRRYILLRGFTMSLLLFAIWFVVTLIEVQFSEFQSALFTWSDYMNRSLIWLVCYHLIGFTLAFSAWKGRERKFDYLT